MSLNQCILFEDIFEVTALNENGKKFERGNFAIQLRATVCDNLAQLTDCIARE